MAPKPTECNSLLAFAIEGTISISVTSETTVNARIALLTASLMRLLSITVAIFSDPKLQEMP